MRINFNPYTLAKYFSIASITLCLLVSSAVSNPSKAATFKIQQIDKSRGKKEDTKSKKDKPEVKEVPKARKQSKPEPVNKGKAKPAGSRGKRG